MTRPLPPECARGAVEVLATIGLPALIVGTDGNVIAANRLIEAMSDVIQWRGPGRVALRDAGSDAVFHSALATIRAEPAAVPRPFAIPATAQTPAIVACLVSISGPARDYFPDCAGILVLTTAAAPEPPPVDLIQSLFDLTSAEARVARGLAAGDTLDDIAAASGVSRNTVRSQLRGALAKTGCNRQSELAALIGGITARIVRPSL